LFEVDNLIENFAISPDLANTKEGTVTPLVKFTQEMDIGDFYVRFAAPIGYLDNDGVLLRSRLGWISTFGLGLCAQLDSSLVDPMEIYQGWRLYVSYSADSFSFNVLTRGWKNTDTGIRIEPNFEYYLGDATISVKGRFEGVGSDGGYKYIRPCSLNKAKNLFWFLD